MRDVTCMSGVARLGERGLLEATLGLAFSLLFSVEEVDLFVVGQVVEFVFDGLREIGLVAREEFGRLFLVRLFQDGAWLRFTCDTTGGLLLLFLFSKRINEIATHPERVTRGKETRYQINGNLITIFLTFFLRFVFCFGLKVKVE